MQDTPETEETKETPLRVCLQLQKGGSGKSTTSVNLCGAANELGYDALLIDLDPQGHATNFLGFDGGDEAEYRRDGTNLYDVLTDPESTDSINELVVSHPEMDVVPSNIDMFGAERGMYDLPEGVDAGRRLSAALEAFDDINQYDLIAIDPPAYMGMLSDNAILAAGNLVVPTQARESSIRALDILLTQIDSVEEFYNTRIDFLAAVLNEVRNDNESREAVEWVEENLGESMPVFEIRTRVALQRAQSDAVSIFEYGEECDMEDEYLDLAEVLLNA